MIVNSEKDKSLAVWCEANTDIGLGHFIRCIAIAEALHIRYNWKIHFITSTKSIVSKGNIDSRFKVHSRHVIKKKKKSLNDWRLEVTLQVKATAVLFDINKNIPKGLMIELRNRNICLVTIDDPTEKRLLCDLVFYPPVPQVERMNWNNFLGEKYCGWEWVPLRSSLLKSRRYINEKEFKNE